MNVFFNMELPDVNLLQHSAGYDCNKEKEEDDTLFSLHDVI